MVPKEHLIGLAREQVVTCLHARESYTDCSKLAQGGAT
jgi:hypothetical protein